jgi:hypothetical protein
MTQTQKLCSASDIQQLQTGCNNITCRYHTIRRYGFLVSPVNMKGTDEDENKRLGRHKICEQELARKTDGGVTVHLPPPPKSTSGLWTDTYVRAKIYLRIHGLHCPGYRCRTG